MCRPYDANEVFVTGTFDDWGKTVKLNRVGGIFIKEVSLPVREKIQYKVCPCSLFLQFFPLCGVHVAVSGCCLRLASNPSFSQWREKRMTLHHAR
jgi:hypothetical protein